MRIASARIGVPAVRYSPLRGVSAGAGDFDAGAADGMLAPRVRVVRVEMTVCLTRHGDKGVRIPYETLFGRAIRCRQHPSVLSMLSVVLTRCDAESTVPLHPFQVIVESAGCAPCCMPEVPDAPDAPVRKREWTDPHYAYFAHTDTSPEGLETTVMGDVRRMVSSTDRLPLVLFEAAPEQSTESHVSEQSALANGLSRPFKQTGDAYHVPVPVEVEAHGTTLHFVTDHNLTRLMVVHPTRVAPQAGELLERDEHFVVSKETVDSLERHMRAQHTERGLCTVVPHADIAVRVLPAHPDGAMGRTVAACATDDVPLLLSIGLEFTVVVAGEPDYAPL